MSIIDAIRGQRDRAYVLLNHWFPVEESLDILTGNADPPHIKQARALIEAHDAGQDIEKIETTIADVQDLTERSFGDDEDEGDEDEFGDGQG